MKLIAFVLMSLAGAAHALELRPMVKFGTEWGGNTIVVAEFDDGDTETIGAHEGFYLGGGVALLPEATNLEIDLSLAFKFATIDARNGDIEWTRWPLEALVFYRWPRWRLGAGPVYHLAPTLDGDGVAGDLKVRFKNALGAVLQADWRITDGMSLGARYTFLRYDAKDPAEEGARSNGWGIAFSFNF
jgi:hypothetical protein